MNINMTCLYVQLMLMCVWTTPVGFAYVLKQWSIACRTEGER